MSEEEKKAYMLLKTVIFQYHGLDEDEIMNLVETATKINAHSEMEWANRFISEDYFTSFERAREYLNEVIGDLSKDKRIQYIKMVWEANNLKGYVTEMEATAMLKFAKDWNLQEEFRTLVNN